MFAARHHRGEILESRVVWVEGVARHGCSVDAAPVTRLARRALLGSASKGPQTAEGEVEMTVGKVAFVMYPVTDMPRAVAFYRDVLGLTKSGLESDFWVEFDVDGVTFGIGNFEQVGEPGSAQSLALEVTD